MDTDDLILELNRVLKYSHETVQNLLTQLSGPEHAQTRQGGPNADRTFRGVLADAIDETDRPDADLESALLRDGGQHVIVHGGVVRPAKYNVALVYDKLDTLAREASGVYGSSPNDQFYGLSHEVHPTDASLHRIWLASAPGTGEPEVIHISQLGKAFADDAEPELLHNRNEHHPRVELALENLRNAPFEQIDHNHPSETERIVRGFIRERGWA
jgi:hypothetical protein